MQLPAASPFESPGLQLNLLVHSPVGLLVVDPQGRRLGYDPAAGGEDHGVRGVGISGDVLGLEAAPIESRIGIARRRPSGSDT